MDIKGGNTTKLQIDTGATCNVLKESELKGTKYQRRIKPTMQVLKMYNNHHFPLWARPTNQEKIQSSIHPRQ